MMETEFFQIMSSGIVTKKRNNRKIYRWKQMGFSSNRKLQEFYSLFKLSFCEGCGMSKHLHSKVFGYNLSIAHVDHNKYNNHTDNLATLCFICHTYMIALFIFIMVEL